jgi:ADP-dependent NAD(P)H-hydrate dehydratase
MPKPIDMTTLPRLPKRAAESHKGTYGRVLLVGGSRGMAGAVALAGMAALRGGAGLVKLAVPDVVLDVVAGFEPCYTTLPLASDSSGRVARSAETVIAELAAESDVVACGPGLGRSADLIELVAALYTSLACPLVVDADALNALAERPEVLEQPGGPRVFTPHLGEFARLVGTPLAEIDDLVTSAASLAGRTAGIVVLKGHATVVADGQEVYRNTSGNPGMATGGSGDVLTGLVAALLCQIPSACDAVRIAVYAHGLAGDLAARELGQVGMIASDLVRFLPHALLAIEVESEPHPCD